MPLQVAIVGAGIGGVTLASYLAKEVKNKGSDKLEVTLFERRSIPSGPSGGALLVQGEGLAVLNDLGIMDTLRDVLPSADTVSVPDVPSNRLPRIEASAAVMTIPGLHRAGHKMPARMYVLRETLLDRLMEGSQEHIALRPNLEVSDVREKDNCVEVDYRPCIDADNEDLMELAKDPDEVTTANFDLVISADGCLPCSHAAKRIPGDGAAPSEREPVLVCQALVPRDTSSTAPMVEQEVYLEQNQGLTGRLDLGSAVGPGSEIGSLCQWDMVNLTVQLEDPVRGVPRPMLYSAVFNRYMMLVKDTHIVRMANGVVARADCSHSGGWLHVWVPSKRDGIGRWVSEGGRLAGLGDAVHPMPPAGGWAASCAMGDARSLAAHITALCTKATSKKLEAEDIRSSLCNYEAARKAVVAPFVAVSVEETKRVIGAK
mmetsp:Transcript_76660/g.151667  ORF Transcript_76660/g.151667 Transcript_76660/m.151667 type:complete len:430 (-) Transcript_76660:169-1458(-)|eukprot:CAMPEP_0172815216 /NCGR_PEP_ID=MMETSP1075-20121228/11643_1 /TAXON_ID=2916 /ORGANISM="Ceratium fusus, Strain PA161109" /LENGTH=429 /DNA_ID=CAMNT_0013655051 /DNA_START=40 /DNA_END=1329 /DNA_ORIENTATION=-